MTYVWRTTVVGAFLILAVTACTSGEKPASRDAPTIAGTSGLPVTHTPNPLEQEISSALSKLGIQAAPAELSLESAQMMASFGDGSELIMTGVRSDADRSEYSVRDERCIEGVFVQSFQHPTTSEIRNRFTCRKFTYEAYGAVPPGFDTFDGFLSRFIAVLNCE